MKRTTCVLLLLLVAASFPAIADAQITSALSGSWGDNLTWTGGIIPTSADDVVIQAGHTISIDDAFAECRDISFGGDDALIDINPNSMMTIYGDFTIFSTSHTVFSAGWSATNAYMKFAGSAVQTLSGFNTTGGSTSLRDVIVDKDGGMLTTSGVGMRLGIQNSLEIVNGVFELAVGDDLEGRWASSGNFRGSNLPNIVVQSGGEFSMVDGSGAHHIRSDYDAGAHIPIGTLTVYGKATFRDASSYKISLSGVDVEAGGKLLTSLGMGGGEFECGPVTVKAGGEVEHYTTSDCWGATAALTLEAGGMFDTKASTTLFPASFVNNGTVRYSRDGTTDQTIVDMDYHRLEISLDEDNVKNWTLAGPRTIADTLKINFSSTLVVAADAPQSLTVGNLLYLTSGQLDNSDPDVSFTMADGAMIQRATGTMTNAPVFAGLVDLRYTSTAEAVTAGPEVPTSAGVINDFTVSGDMGVTLAADIVVGGICTTSGSDLITGPYSVTLGAAAALVESDSTTVLGTALVERTVAQSLNETFGGIGLELTAAGGAPGLTQVVRTTGTALDVDGLSSIERYFEVTPANNAGLDASVVVHYDESELGGMLESSLGLYSTFDGGANWNVLTSTVDESGNTISVSGVASLATLTAAQSGPTGVDDGLVPARTELVSVYPNPFNPATKIVFSLKSAGQVDVGVYDVRGHRVKVLVSGALVQGQHDLTWRGLDDSGQAVASGVYFCRLLADGESQTMKMLLTR